VLVADDHAQVTKAVCRVLATDYDVVATVADGQLLLETARRLQPEVVVLDINLPNLHGLTACRQLLEMDPALKVVVFSAASDPELCEAMMAAGASAFVSKLASADLAATIGRLCDL
jgi:DNA-binding NarL/FixJ family response regulator